MKSLSQHINESLVNEAKRKRTDIKIYRYDKLVASSYGILIDSKSANLNIAMTSDNKKRDGGYFMIIYDTDKREQIWSTRSSGFYQGKKVDSSAFVILDDDISDIKGLSSNFK